MDRVVVLCVMCNAIYYTLYVYHILVYHYYIMAISPANVLPILNTCEHEVANLCNVELHEYFLQDVHVVYDVWRMCLFDKVIKLADINFFTQKALKKYVPRSDGAVDEQVCRGIDNLRGKEICSCKKEISIDKDGDIGQKNMGGKSKDNSPDQCSVWHY